MANESVRIKRKIQVFSIENNCIFTFIDLCTPVETQRVLPAVILAAILAGLLGVFILKQNQMTQRIRTAATAPLTAAAMIGVFEGGVVSSKGEGGKYWIAAGGSSFVTTKGA